MNYRIFSSESVASGHPDKICDQISDGILDACLSQDKHSHVAVECLVTVNRVVLAGEIKSKAKIDFIKVTRNIIKKLGYTDPRFNFTYLSPIDNFLIAHEMALRCEVQVAYVIGRRQPVLEAIETFGTECIDKKKIEKYAWNLLDLSVPGIIKGLDLLRPFYGKTARYGHFGRKEFNWEKIVN